jgi:ParB family transcriptional regulator, chromosome partitioning protein
MAKQPKTTPLSQKLRRDLFFGTSPDLPKIIEVDLAKLRPNPDQPRTTTDPISLEELACSIAKHGLIQPIAVARDPEETEGFIIVAGERRYRAFQHLRKESIPAIITTGDPAEIALIENIQREDLHPLDEARALTRLMQKHGYTQDEVSKVVGKARRTVGELLMLTTLPQHIQEEWRTSAIPKSTLIEIARIDTAQEQLTLWEHVKHGGMTVREARATKRSSQAPGIKRHPPDMALKAGRGFAQRLKRVVVDGDGAEEDLLRALQHLYEEIGYLLEQLAARSKGS